jgi:hypothetical protein
MQAAFLSLAAFLRDKTTKELPGLAKFPQNVSGPSSMFQRHQQATAQSLVLRTPQNFLAFK